MGKNILWRTSLIQGWQSEYVASKKTRAGTANTSLRCVMTKMVEAHLPLSQLILKPTLYCYHKCSYCNLRQRYYRDILHSTRMGGGKSAPGNMPLDMALRVIDQAAELGMTSLQLSGGDPLLYPKLVDLIRAGARHPGVFVFMNSTGSTVTKEQAEKIIASGLGAWNFSVDTLCPQKFELLRGVPNALSALMNGVETVRQAAAEWPGFCINYMTVITRHNFRDLPALLRHCIQTGVSSMYLMNVYGDIHRTALLSEVDIACFRDEVVPEMLAVITESAVPEVVQLNAHEVLGSLFSPDNQDADYAHGQYWPTMDAAVAACQAPTKSLLVEPDGSVFGCCQGEVARDGQIGTAAKQSLRELWCGEAFAHFRRARIPFCTGCSSPRHRTLGLIPKMCRQF
jgi:MoaA/NifB/PqqE/SkfB family radical SAM enzyme